MLQRVVDDAADVLVVQCEPEHRASPLHPFLTEVARACTWTRDGGDEERLASTVGERGASVVAAASRLPTLLELEGR